MTVGGDKLNYPDETASPTASLIETKLFVASVISDHKLNNAKFCSVDIKDFDDASDFDDSVNDAKVDGIFKDAVVKGITDTDSITRVF